MASPFNPEAVDLASVRDFLHDRCGSFVEGDVVGRTRLRDEVSRQLGCSELEAERLVDTMVGRGFLERQVLADGRTGWSTDAE
jgi:hypothetical protein